MPVKTKKEALDFVKRHGAVLESAKGTIPSLAQAIAGEPIRGSWWGHPKGNQIYMLLNDVCDSPDIVRCRLMDGKITLVHRRLWPAARKDGFRVRYRTAVCGSRGTHVNRRASNGYYQISRLGTCGGPSSGEDHFSDGRNRPAWISTE
jgi:hypothetical protein